MPHALAMDPASHSGHDRMQGDMGFRSVIYGHIQTLNNGVDEPNRQALQTFDYDPTYPFPDIFHLERPPQYHAPSVVFGGTFKQIEDDWPAWVERFATLLSTLEAVEATVTLDCWRGRYTWVLAPETLARGGTVTDRLNQRGTMVGEPWFVVQSPALPEELLQLLATGSVTVAVPNPT